MATAALCVTTISLAVVIAEVDEAIVNVVRDNPPTLLTLPKRPLVNPVLYLKAIIKAPPAPTEVVVALMPYPSVPAANVEVAL